MSEFKQEDSCPGCGFTLQITVNKLISEFVNDLENSPLNASHIESHESYMMTLLEKWEGKQNE